MLERTKILIADDAEINREILKDIFEEQFTVLEAANGEEAVQLIEDNKEELAVVFLDLIMPIQNGLDVLEYMTKMHYMDFLPVIMITGESTPESDEKAYEYGVSDIINKPFSPRVVMRRTMNIIELFLNRLDIEEKLEIRTKQLRESREKLSRNNEFLINALSSVVEFRSLETGDHVKRVGYFTRIMLKYLRQNYPEYNLDDEAVETIVRASALHDIGKIAIADNILMKPGKLLPQEFDEMKKHTVYGCEILEKFKQEEDDFYRYCYDICRYHHEKWDGSGYPDKLVGDAIPIWAQVVAVADCYDALVSKRVYKDAFASDTAMAMIENGECGEFSAKILDCLAMARQEFFDATELSEQFNFSEGEV